MRSFRVSRLAAFKVRKQRLQSAFYDHRWVSARHDMTHEILNPTKNLVSLSANRDLNLVGVRRKRRHTSLEGAMQDSNSV